MSQLDLIWNISLVCPWHCDFCCTDAAHVSKKGSSVIILDNGLTRKSITSSEHTRCFRNKHKDIEPSIYDIALMERQRLGLEISFSEKLKIIENLKGKDVHIDFAGGEPLCCYENFIVIAHAAKTFGKENISVTSTGVIHKDISLESLAGIIGEYEFTFDNDSKQSPCRPRGYNNNSLKIAKKMASLGVRTKAQVPIQISNISPESIRSIYKNINEAEINEVLLMRLFPTGRTGTLNHKVSNNELHSAINTWTSISKNMKTRLRIQCALKGALDKPITTYNPCDAITSSLGINFQGLALVSAWANNQSGQPIDDDFILGDLKKTTIEKIQNSEKYISYKNRANDNFGHCKVFSWMESRSLFEKNDPLHIPNSSVFSRTRPD